jgi:hypothetical protein
LTKAGQSIGGQIDIRPRPFRLKIEGDVERDRGGPIGGDQLLGGRDRVQVLLGVRAVEGGGGVAVVEGDHRLSSTTGVPVGGAASL